MSSAIRRNKYAIIRRRRYSEHTLSEDNTVQLLMSSGYKKRETSTDTKSIA